MRIRLGEEDRKALGCDEFLEWEDRAPIDELIDLEEQARISPTEYKALIGGKPVFENGQPVLNESGSQRREHTAKAYKVVVWQALRRAGIPQPWAGLTFDWDEFQSFFSDDESKPDDDTEDKTPESD